MTKNTKLTALLLAMALLLPLLSVDRFKQGCQD